MSLRAFHLFFIAVSTLLSLFLIGWGVVDYRATGASIGIVLAIAGVVGLLLLVGYFRWFQRKNLGKLSTVLGLVTAGVLHLSTIPFAQACSVCYNDPDSPLTKGAITGVLVLFGVIVTVLGLILTLALSWIKRARTLSTHL